MIFTLQTPTNNKLEDSKDFYERLGFTRVSEADPLVYTDGKAYVEINPDRFARAGLRCYKDSWAEDLEWLKQVTTVTKLEKGWVLSDASNVWLYLVEGKPSYSIHSSEKSYSVLGNYVGLSLETADFSRSVAIYKALGFTQTSGGEEHAWSSFAYEGFSVTLMGPMSCPHLFFNPSMTYFNGGNNLPVVEKIRELNIQITEEITLFNKDGLVDNVIIRDPGGFGFFVFND
jgi:hypothetical protein